MLPLCEILHISVNELLSGERLHDSEYKKKAEKNIMNLMEQRQQAKRNLWLGILAVVSTFLAGFTLIMVSGWLEMEVWQRVVLIVIGFISIVSGIAVAVVLEVNSGSFECSKCGKRFMPKMSAYLCGAHTTTRRKMKCPFCGVKNWCVRRFSLLKDDEEQQ